MTTTTVIVLHTQARGNSCADSGGPCAFHAPKSLQIYNQISFAVLNPGLAGMYVGENLLFFGGGGTGTDHSETLRLMPAKAQPSPSRQRMAGDKNLLIAKR